MVCLERPELMLDFNTVFENHRKSLNIAREASYVYNLSGQKFVKIPKIVNSGKPKAFGQTALPDMSVIITQKLVKNVKSDIFKNFQTLCSSLARAQNVQRPRRPFEAAACCSAH